MNVDWLNAFITAVAAALVGAITFLIRKVLTNDGEIQVLKSQVVEFKDALDEVRENTNKILFTMLDKNK